VIEHAPEIAAWAERFGLPTLLLILFLWRIEPRLDRLTSAVLTLTAELNYALADHSFTGTERRHQHRAPEEPAP